VFAVGHQVEVVRELHHLGQLLQDVDAEALAAQLGVGIHETIATETTPGKKEWTNQRYSELPQCLQDTMSPGTGGQNC